MSQPVLSGSPVTSGSFQVTSEDEAVLRRAKRLGELVAQQLSDDWSGADRLAEVSRYSVSGRGKLFRPILLLESAAAVGGEHHRVLTAAAGTEGAHVASLVHDDIIDGDRTRRGRPATHIRFGRDDAIVAGDALIFYLFGALARCYGRGIPAKPIVEAMTEAARAGDELCRGQLMEENIRSTFDCRVTSYLEMIDLKTAALFRACCRIGAVLGGGDPGQVEALGRYGTALGIAFQIQDDLLPYVSTAEEIGKSPSSDLANRRLTLPLLLCRAGGDQARVAELDALLHGSDDLHGRYTRLAGLLTQSGALTEAAEMARDHAEQALAALQAIPDTESRRSLGYFARTAYERYR
jgi:geranylgeranyl diphosphate synthase type I